MVNPQSPERRISPHLKRVLSPPRGEIQSISPHRHTTNANQLTTCATQWSEIGRITPQEKKKKFRRGKNQMPGPQASWATGFACQNDSCYGLTQKRQGEGIYLTILCALRLCERRRRSVFLLTMSDEIEILVRDVNDVEGHVIARVKPAQRTSGRRGDGAARHAAWPLLRNGPHPAG